MIGLYNRLGTEYPDISLFFLAFSFFTFYTVQVFLSIVQGLRAKSGSSGSAKSGRRRSGRRRSGWLVATSLPTRWKQCAVGSGVPSKRRTGLGDDRKSLKTIRTNTNPGHKMAVTKFLHLKGHTACLVVSFCSSHMSAVLHFLHLNVFSCFHSFCPCPPLHSSPNCWERAEREQRPPPAAKPAAPPPQGSLETFDIRSLRRGGPSIIPQVFDPQVG